MLLGSLLLRRGAAADRADRDRRQGCRRPARSLSARSASRGTADGSRCSSSARCRSTPKRDTGPVWSRADEARATRFGTLLRRSSLDELPQLFNVLRGEMSLVGPRPERPEFVEQFRDDIPGYMQKHLVKAGITGWAQVNDLRGDSDLARADTIRPVLHRELVALVRPANPRADALAHPDEPQRALTRCTARRARRSRRPRRSPAVARAAHDCASCPWSPSRSCVLAVPRDRRAGHVVPFGAPNARPARPQLTMPRGTAAIDGDELDRHACRRRREHGHLGHHRSSCGRLPGRRLASLAAFPPVPRRAALAHRLRARARQQARRWTSKPDACCRADLHRRPALDRPHRRLALVCRRRSRRRCASRRDRQPAGAARHAARSRAGVDGPRAVDRRVDQHGGRRRRRAGPAAAVAARRCAIALVALVAWLVLRARWRATGSRRRVRSRSPSRSSRGSLLDARWMEPLRAGAGDRRALRRARTRTRKHRRGRGSRPCSRSSRRRAPKLPREPARVFVVADADYFRGRAAYHLYPHNVLFDPYHNAVPPADRLRAGDWLVVYQRRGVQYDAAHEAALGRRRHRRRSISSCSSTAARLFVVR